MANIKLTPDQSQFIEQTASCVDKEWYYMPFWFHKIRENIFEVIEFNRLPSYMRLKINELRNQSK